jgi:hypothetical protein
MRTVALAALLSLAVVLLGALGLEFGAASMGNEAVSLTPSNIPVSPGFSRSPPMSPNATWESMILERPLFNRDRRPVAARVVAGGAAPGLPRLAGIVIYPTGRMATFAPADGGKPVVAQEGARVGGFTIQAIQAGQVTVSGPDGVRVLRPSFDQRPAPAGKPGLALGLPAFPGLPMPPPAGFTR